MFRKFRKTVKKTWVRGVAEPFRAIMGKPGERKGVERRKGEETTSGGQFEYIKKAPKGSTRSSMVTGANQRERTRRISDRKKNK